MTRSNDARVLSPGEGQTIYVVGDRYTLKATGRQTGGAFMLLEAWIAPNGGPPPHRHSREDEFFYVLEGQLLFHSEGREFRAGSGSTVYLPRGTRHYFRNTETTPAKMLVLAVPAGLEEFFLEVGAPGTNMGTPSPPAKAEIDKLIALAPKYGLEIFA